MGVNPVLTKINIDCVWGGGGGGEVKLSYTAIE